MNLREMVDGTSGLSLNVKPKKASRNFKAQQEVIVRRNVQNAARTPTTELIVGKILAVGNGRATVSIPKPGGTTQRMEVNVSDLQPVTEAYRRSSHQFSPAGMRRV